MKPLLYSMFGFLRPRQTRREAPLTLRAGFDRYLREVSTTKKNGAPQDASLVRVWMKTEYADWPMSQLSGSQVAMLRDVWLKGYKPATVVRRLAILSHLYSTARTEWSHRELENPVKMIRKPKVRNSRERRLYTDINLKGYPSTELEWLCGAVRSRYLEPVVVLATETAMRRGELASLEWENIDFSARKALLLDTKNGHDRAVPLSPLAVKTLQ